MHSQALIVKYKYFEERAIEINVQERVETELLLIQISTKIFRTLK
jgi:hypothetical protein